MPDDFGNLDVKHVFGGQTPYPKGPVDNRERHRERRERRDRSKRSPGEYFRTLEKAAESSNEILVKNNSPYRFCVYERGKEIFIDLVVLNEKGEVIQEKVRNITHDQFESLIEDIAGNQGLFMDLTA